VILLDSGDSLFATGAIETANDDGQGALLTRAMTAMGYDAMALGAQDLAPAPIAQARFQEAGFPILSTNVAAAGILTNVRPYLLQEVEGRTPGVLTRIAIVGATNEATMEQRAQALGMSLEVGDAVEAIRRTVEEVQKQADVIIVLGNLSQETNELLVHEVPGIDAIIGVYGSWQIHPTAVQGPEGQVVLHASGTLGEYLGVLTLYFDTQGRVVSFEGSGVALTPDYGDDPDIKRILLHHRYCQAVMLARRGQVVLLDREVWRC